MLLFIHPWKDGPAGIRSFQYISCYSLSKEVINMKKTLSRFNTSHVTLYPKRNNFKSVLDRVSIHLMLLFIVSAVSGAPLISSFQYISCYSLSEKFAVSDYIVNKFQYISCYSLSFTGRREKREIAVSIHLMLLFIRVATVIESCFAKFQYISCYSLSALYYSDQALETCFNTSHVTLYR